MMELLHIKKLSFFALLFTLAFSTSACEAKKRNEQPKQEQTNEQKQNAQKITPIPKSITEKTGSPTKPKKTQTVANDKKPTVSNKKKTRATQNKKSVKTNNTDKPTTKQNLAIPKKKQVKDPNTQTVFTHTLFDRLLSKHVNTNGRVSYRGFLKDKDVLNTYISSLATQKLSDKTKKQQLAFWINAYNACTIQLILNNYPVKSITEIASGKPWTTVKFKIANQSLTLDQIENEIIRPQFKEPRIHFAVNCAAISCPPLLNEAYTANKLEQQLEKQTQKFINNTTFNKLDTNNFIASKIFEWYAEDFGDLETYIRQYKKLPKEVTFTYMSYNWDLNSAN